MNTSVTTFTDDCWRMVDQYRVGDIFIRILVHHDDDEHFTYIIANSAQGLDSPHALRVLNSRHLWNALSLAAEVCCLTLSATPGEERAHLREYVRFGAVGIDEEPPVWFSPEEHFQESSPDRPDPTGEWVECPPFCQDFKAGAFYGRVYREDRWDGSHYEVMLARSREELGTPQAFRIGTHASAYRALWAASVIIDQELGGSQMFPSGYRELFEAGFILFDTDQS